MIQDLKLFAIRCVRGTNQANLEGIARFADHNLTSEGAGI